MTGKATDKKVLIKQLRRLYADVKKYEQLLVDTENAKHLAEYNKRSWFIRKITDCSVTHVWVTGRIKAILQSVDVDIADEYTFTKYELGDFVRAVDIIKRGKNVTS